MREERYGLQRAAIVELFEFQAGRCGLCVDEFATPAAHREEAELACWSGDLPVYGFHVDHDQDGGDTPRLRARGLLCNRCNQALKEDLLGTDFRQWASSAAAWLGRARPLAWPPIAPVPNRWGRAPLHGPQAYKEWLDYGLTRGDKARLLTTQGGCCGICDRSFVRRPSPGRPRQRTRRCGSVTQRPDRGGPRPRRGRRAAFRCSSVRAARARARPPLRNLQLGTRPSSTLPGAIRACRGVGGGTACACTLGWQRPTWSSPRIALDNVALTAFRWASRDRVRAFRRDPDPEIDASTQGLPTSNEGVEDRERGCRRRDVHRGDVAGLRRSFHCRQADGSTAAPRYRRRGAMHATARSSSAVVSPPPSGQVASISLHL